MFDKNFVKQNTDINRKMILWACDNENNVTASYSNYLTSIAGFFLVAFPFIFDKIIFDTNLWSKLSISASTIFVFVSLIFGGLHILFQKKFFSKWANNYSTIFSKWNNCKDEKDEESAIACEECIYKGNKTKSSQWPLVLQSIFLFLGMFIAVLISVIKIF